MDTCPVQKDCLIFTTTKLVEGASCDGDCAYEMCAELDLSNPNCVKSGSVSHTCIKDGSACSPATGFDGAKEESNIPDGHKQCQIVKGGASAEFLFKDGPRCGGAASYISGEVTTTCEPRTFSVPSCTGNKEGKECIWTSTAPECESCPEITLNFNDGLTEGQYITDQLKDEYYVVVQAEGGEGTASSAGAGVARVFNTANPKEDPDLGSPNGGCVGGGPGVGDGGAPQIPESEYENCKSLGNVLIIEESGGSDPDDNEFSGIITFTFTRPATILSVSILDIDEGTVERPATPTIFVSYVVSLRFIIIRCILRI
jgi:hypothetical protein